MTPLHNATQQVDMQQSPSGGCLVKKAVTAAQGERQKSVGVESPLGAWAERQQSSRSKEEHDAESRGATQRGSKTARKQDDSN